MSGGLRDLPACKGAAQFPFSPLCSQGKLSSPTKRPADHGVTLHTRKAPHDGEGKLSLLQRSPPLTSRPLALLCHSYHAHPMPAAAQLPALAVRCPCPCQTWLHHRPGACRQPAESLYSPWSTRVLPKMRVCSATQTSAKEAHTGTLIPSPTLLDKPASATGPPKCSGPGHGPGNSQQINKFK